MGVHEATGEHFAELPVPTMEGDAEAFAAILNGIDEAMQQVSGDGADGKRTCHDAIQTEARINQDPVIS